MRHTELSSVITESEIQQKQTTQVYVEHGIFQKMESENICASFAPLHYEPNYAYPLIIWLHGDGQDESQLLRVMPVISLRNYVAISPRAPAKEIFRCKQVPDRRVHHKKEISQGYTWNINHLNEAQQLIEDGIRTAGMRYRISPRRIYLVGVESGGTLALQLALLHPELYAGVASFNGPFSESAPKLQNLRQLQDLSIFMGISRSSCAFPVEVACEQLRLMHTAGLYVAFKNYPTAEVLHPEMLRDVDRWIMQGIDTVIQ